MLTEIEKIAALRRNEGRESPLRKTYEQDVEVVFKKHVRRILRGEKRFSFSNVRVSHDVQIRTLNPMPGVYRAHITLGEFGGVSADQIAAKVVTNKDIMQLPSDLEALHDKEKEDLKMKIELLEHQLHCDRSHLQLFRLGAASLLISLLSILFWWRTGVGAPFHPVFAAVVIPVAAGLMAMAFLIKSTKLDEKTPGNT
jgi:hypothetical protein